MKKYNIIMVFNPTMSHILFCKRTKEPYKGLKNLVGGKIEPGESSLDAAYRELFEETHISSDDITLHHIMDFQYYTSNILLESYAGRLKTDVSLFGDEKELHWNSCFENFFDARQYAGEGNIGHLLEQALLHPHLFI